MDPWAGDKLGRKSDGEHLKEFLIKRYEARVSASGGSASTYILNIDARWGEGKSFFLNCFARDLERSGYTVARVNAWEDDMSSDPLTTVMAAIDLALQPFLAHDKPASVKFRRAKEKLGAVAVEATKQVAIHALKVFTGFNAAALAKSWDDADGHALLSDEQAKKVGEAAGESVEKSIDVKSKEIVEDRITAHRTARKSVIEFKNCLAETRAELEVRLGKSRPLFMMVDELDRCRPDYAIRLHEEIKHLFDVPGIVFIVATDTNQLAHSVSAIYGEKFDGGRYLRRFYDSVFVFSEVDRGIYVEYLAKLYEIDFDKFIDTYNIHPIQHILSWASAFQLSNRDLAQCLEMISTALNSWTHRTPIEPISFLCMVYAIYARLPAREYLRRGLSGSTSELNRWKISYYTQDHTLGDNKKIEIDADVFLAKFLSISVQGVSKFYDISEYPFQKIFEHESRDLYNNSFTVGKFYNSVSREYYSRLENSGRYIPSL